MAKQSPSRIKGDDYQHLYSWLQILELLRPTQCVASVRVEDPDASHVDDVTVRLEPGKSKPDRYYQVKYHVDATPQYTAQSFIDRDPGSTSLLGKFWKTWKKMQDSADERAVELWLYSNWSWDPNVMLGVDNETCALNDSFFTATEQSGIGKVRETWRNHLDADASEFKSFARCLRFYLGDHTAGLLERVRERMENLRLCSDENALLIAAGIVREWIKTQVSDITRAILEETLTQHDLYLPPDVEPCVTVYLSTVQQQTFDMPPDYELDWREHFEGDPNKKGHQIKDPALWNAVMLPELAHMATIINASTPCRLIRARGLARLSAWFAFGYTFSEVARYTIEIDQQGELWRTSATPSADFQLHATNGVNGETLSGSGDTVAVGISVAADLVSGVRDHIVESNSEAAAVMFLRPERALGRECFRNAGDVVAFADQAKSLMRAFVNERRAKRLQLYYSGPLSGACFLGHRLNAVCREIQIMEFLQPGYDASFLLR